MVELNPCPLCGGTDIAAYRYGRARQDILTGKWEWEDQYESPEIYMQCNNEKCLHETKPSRTMKDAINKWNAGEVPQWERAYYDRTN